MMNSIIPTTATNLDTGAVNSGESSVPPHASIDEKVQKSIDNSCTAADGRARNKSGTS